MIRLFECIIKSLVSLIVGYGAHKNGLDYKYIVPFVSVLFILMCIDKWRG